MARPIDEGLSYFSLDVDFYDDPKIILIEEQYGVKGGYIANRLLCWIYRNGYYLEWDDNMALVFAKRVGNGVTGALVNEVVNSLVKCSFFDEGVFDSRSILTSKGIQKRWMKVITDARRKARINPGYDLLNVPDRELMREETIPNRAVSTHSKEEYRKVKERIEEEKPPASQFGEVVLKHIDQLKADCLNDQITFVEHICRQYSLTPDDIPKLLDEFNSRLTYLQTTVKSVKDYRSHFGNWLQKRPPEVKTGQEKVKIRVK